MDSLRGLRLAAWNWAFLVFTILTSVTGFFFPFHGITPGIVVGVLSLIVLAVAVLAWNKKWTKDVHYYRDGCGVFLMCWC